MFAVKFLWTIPDVVMWSISKYVRDSWDRRIPYYLRIRNHFASLIEVGALSPGMKLPSERTLRDEFRVTRVTARQALTQLETEGLIYREKRRGWFVSPPRIRYDPTANVSFTECVKSQNRVPGTTVLSKQRLVASTWESERLGIDVGDPIFLIRRLRLVDGRTVLLEYIHVNAARCPDLLDLPLDLSLTELMLERYGITEHRPHISMRPTALGEPEARALGVSIGTPSLYLSRKVYDQFDNVIEFDQEFWRHDALEISVDVQDHRVSSARRQGAGVATRDVGRN